MRAPALLVLALALPGCKTRLLDFDGRDGGPDGLGGPPDFAPRADLVAIPDFLPPPDLTLPFICRNIYVLEDSQRILGFDTEAATFVPAGTLACPGLARNARPATMSIARDGIAWVLYTSGQLFHVDLNDPVHRGIPCTATAFDRNRIPANALVGSSFSADAPGSNGETLFFAIDNGNGVVLRSLDRQSLRLSDPVQLMSIAELAGTQAADLWGYFPGDVSSTIGRIDKETGMVDMGFELPEIKAGHMGFAFSFWGGSFWVFNGEGPGGNTRVYQIDAQTHQIVTMDTLFHIVGAGVSSCAPLGLDR